MPALSLHAIREKYVKFFEAQGHVRLPSAPLVPENDPTTLFTGSGMQPLLPYLLGQSHSQGQRLVNSQKCFRAPDMDEIGDNRHTTFFEMLGNWSLGDYFKQEQIAWIFEFMTKELGLDPERLYVTAFRGNEALNIPRDEESAKLWQKEFKKVGIEASIADNPETLGLQNARIFYYDERKNWWSRAGGPASMPVGEPGGPDTEMFWDFGAERQLHEHSSHKDQPCHVNCDCGRFMEIGNSVFMQYRQTEHGFKLLPQQNVDFGGGLERLAAAMSDNHDIFLLDVFAPSRQKLETMSGITYSHDAAATKAFRVILDHLRAATFLIADGVIPGNKDHGYFARRLIRRAIRFAHQLSIKENFCATLAQEVITYYTATYPNLKERQAVITEELTKEEEKFRHTLTAGLRVFLQAMAQQDRAGKTPGPPQHPMLRDPQHRVFSGPGVTEARHHSAIISAQTAFDLYQSYGFPLEITQELAAEQGLTVDTEGFKQLFAAHQDTSRAGAEQKFKGGLADHSQKSIHYHTATHLLHQALRTVLGPHVLQRGSNITANRLRFDFSHPAKPTPEHLAAVADLVNEKIKANLPVTHREMTVAEAKQQGALGLFEHKYGDKVSVYTMGDFSREICGGPHVEHTGELGHFKITKEEAVSAGIRRIKAVLEGQ